MKTYFDEFTKLSLNKMAQKITDMTYCYQETRVPITHYKKLLGKSAEEMVESSVAINLIIVGRKSPYFSEGLDSPSLRQ